MNRHLRRTALLTAVRLSASTRSRSHATSLAAVASAFLLPGAGGLVLAGAGAGLWIKAIRIGQRERRDDALYWVRTDWGERGRPAGKRVKGYRTTGPMAGDAAPGGARRRR